MPVIALTWLACGTASDDNENVRTAEQALTIPFQLLDVEPNDTVANAVALPATQGAIYGNLFPGTPAAVDLYKFVANPGDRVYAATMSAYAASASTDTDITILDTNGTTILEYDDLNGTFGSLTGAVAGTVIPAGNPPGSTYYIKQHHFSSTGTSMPYHLHYAIQSGSPTPETEPNDTTVAPQPLPASGWVSGTLSALDPNDIFAITANAGDTISILVDCDPERDGTDTVLQAGIGLFGTAGATFIAANDSGSTGADAEQMLLTVKDAGTYYALVGIPSGTGGSYHAKIMVLPAATKGTNCTTYTNSTPVVIPTVTGNVSSTITVPGNPRIGDIEVSLNLDHTSMADLDVDLVAPSGTNVALFNDVGTTTETKMNVRISGGAAIPIASSTIVSGMASLPELNYRMDWFEGMSAGGDWTLNLRDDLTANGGTLNSWSITICDADPLCPTGGNVVPLASAGFETTDDGFTHSGTGDEWQRGLPSLAPMTTCNTGTGCFKTDLVGTYNASADYSLLSPVVNLAGVTGPIYLTWAQQFQMEVATSDQFEVDVQDSVGGNVKRLYEWTGATMTASVGSPAVTINETAGWSTMKRDVTYLAGMSAQMKVHLKTSSSTNLAGVAIDDVMLYTCAFGVCGDGVADPGQPCDDGNSTNGDGCDNNCTITACGNGIQTGAEICDDGNVVNGDGCDNNCTLSACGNGAKAPTEQCDDGNLVSGDGCDSNCKTTACGNGVVTGVETCDDGNLVSGDGCDGNCTPTGCPNGILTAGESCDDGNATNGDGCDVNCTFTSCGNGVTGGAEQCDDGNFTSGDGCDANCSLTGCGNGITTSGEACDDLNQVNGDGCDNNCTITACGNAIVTGLEACDDGNGQSGDGCDVNCTVSACGNGIVAGAETCDDGNLVDGDGCDSNCTSTTCGNGVVTLGEACDDGNVTNDDGCDSNCTATACGNGVQTSLEACDDGDLVDGDGCDSNCTVTICGNGVPTDGEECDDGNQVEGDGCDNNCKFTSCGNGVLTDGEVCDDGNQVDGDGCDNNCTDTACGNGVITDPEICDDANVVSGDGCDENCTPTECGNTIVTDPETCDDGNDVDGDGCDTNCTDTACGNGVVTDGEVCDDDNDVDGDGCDSNCTETACGNMVVTDGEECDDGNTDAGDGCDATCKTEQGGTGGGGAGGGGEGGSTSSTGTTGSTGSGTIDETGPGGGCGCTVPADDSKSSQGAALAVVALGLAFARRRRAA